MPPGPARRGLLTFVVGKLATIRKGPKCCRARVSGGEPFEVPWPYLALHSPVWAQKLAEAWQKSKFLHPSMVPLAQDPDLAVIELEGEARSRVLLLPASASTVWLAMACSTHLDMIRAPQPLGSSE